MRSTKKRKSGSSRRTRRNTKEQGSKVLIGATVGVAAAVLSGMGWLVYDASLAERPDEFGCYDRPGQHELVVWADYSLRDETEQQFRDYAVAAMAQYDAAPANAKVMISTTGQAAHSNIVAPVFVICKPAETPAQQEALGLTVSGDRVLGREADIARGKFRAAVDEMIAGARDTGQQALNSPLLEQVRSISKAPWFQGESRSLLMITDGLQSSRVARFCEVAGDMPSFTRFSEKPTYRRVKPESLLGTSVTVLMVESVVIPQNGLSHCTGYEEVRVWWEDFFHGNDADSVDIVPLDRGVGA